MRKFRRIVFLVFFCTTKPKLMEMRFFETVPLDDEMKKLDTRFVFGYYPGDHFTLNTPEYQAAGATFLAQRYAQWKMLHP